MEIVFRLHMMRRNMIAQRIMRKLRLKGREMQAREAIARSRTRGSNRSRPTAARPVPGLGRYNVTGFRD